MRTLLEIENDLFPNTRDRNALKINNYIRTRKKERKENGYENCSIVTIQDRHTLETHVISNSLEWKVYGSKEKANEKELYLYGHLRKAITDPENFKFEGVSKYYGAEGAAQYLDFHLGKYHKGNLLTLTYRDVDHNSLDQITFNMSQYSANS